MLPVTHTIDGILDSLVGQHTIVATLLGSADGEPLAGRPQTIAESGGARAARWAADILESMHGLKAQLPDDDFSIVRDKPMYGGAHVLVLGFPGHFLLLSYNARDCLGGVRQASQVAIRELRELLDAGEGD